MSQHSLDDFNLDEVSDGELEEKMSQNESEDINEDINEDSEIDDEIEKNNDNEEDEDENMKGGGDESEEYEGEEYDDEKNVENETKKEIYTNKKGQTKQLDITESDEDDDDEDEGEDENYLMKFDREIRKNYLVDFHPETLVNNYSEIQALVNITRDDRGVIIDEFHKTLPFLTKYEKTRVLGQRTKQINSGAKPYIDINREFNNKRVIDGNIIALKELELKRIPFIIRRPLPNGGSEYWRLQDLELIN